MRATKADADIMDGIENALVDAEEAVTQGRQDAVATCKSSIVDALRMLDALRAIRGYVET